MQDGRSVQLFSQDKIKTELGGSQKVKTFEQSRAVFSPDSRCFLSKCRKNVGIPRKTHGKNLDKIVEQNIVI